MNNPAGWQSAFASAICLREDPVHSLFAVNRHIFTAPGLFELEMRHTR